MFGSMSRMNTPEKPKPKITDPKKALEKAAAWCAYQERCQQEVRDKLYEWGLWKDMVEQIISELIGQGFIDEERFARTYAGGKFRIKKWGKQKIKNELKQRHISEYCIRKAMLEIDADAYRKTLEKILDDYGKKVKSSNSLQ
ncbi:MAG TPA: RecX family transcriptional regulator, partial [Bacteroidia bacterium]|nr:RecX family transcriptional regulator [Bacteroidia bacterium]